MSREPRRMLRHLPALSVAVHHGHFMDTHEKPPRSRASADERAIRHRAHYAAACLASRQEDAASPPNNATEAALRADGRLRTTPSHRFPAERVSAEPWWRARTIRGLGTDWRERDGTYPDLPSQGLSPSPYSSRQWQRKGMLETKAGRGRRRSPGNDCAIRRCGYRWRR